MESGSKVVIDYYSILQVDPLARPEVIHAAYIALMKAYMPKGEGTGNETMAARVNGAYEVLSNPDRRQQYDLSYQERASGTVGHYKLLRLLAEGGHCDVYLAEHTLNGAQAVVKHCRGLGHTAQQLLIDESKILSEIRHFAVPKFREVFRLPDGSIVLVEDYIAGPTLEQFVRGVGPLEPEMVCWIMSRILQILKYLHYNGVIHGDIKPANLILWPDEHQVFLIDFGIAMFKPQLGDKNKGGIEIYSAPEQLQPGHSRILPPNDFYSLGMTALFALTANDEATAAKQFPDTVSELIERFIKKLTDPQPENRPEWGEEDNDPEELLLEVRENVFGRARSGFIGVEDWKAKVGWE